MKGYLKVMKIYFTVQIDCTGVFEVCIVKANEEFFTTLFSIKGSAEEKLNVSVEWPEDGVQTARLNEYNLQCTKILKMKVGKRIYSRPVAKAKYEFESHRSDQNNILLCE